MPSKEELRRLMLQERDRLGDRDARSTTIQSRLLAMAEFQNAGTILTYVGVGSEVRTDRVIADALASARRVAAPYVTPEGLKAAYIRGPGDLAPARFGLLEPSPPVQGDAERACHVSDVDLFVVPGVAFDGQGGRLGHGRAYYDRLLATARSDALFIALAFESQMVPEVPMTATDVAMHVIITEQKIYRPARS